MLVHILDEEADVLDRRVRQDAVAEVEDVPGATGSLVEDLLGLASQVVTGSEERGRVEVALDGAIGADCRPGVGQCDTPVDADHIGTGGGEQGQEASRASAEEDDRDVERLERGDDALCPGQDSALVVEGAERTGPAVEELHGLDASCDLCLQVGDGDRREPLHQRVPGGWLMRQQVLGGQVVAGTAAFDQVAGERERRAGEADKRDAAVERAPDEADALEHAAGKLLGFRLAQLGDVGRGADGRRDDRALTGAEVERAAEAGDRQQEVSEDDRGIDAEGLDRLERDLGDEGRVSADLKQRGARADSAIRREVAPSLAHEPDGGCIDRLATAGTQEPRGVHASLPAPAGRPAPGRFYQMARGEAAYCPQRRRSCPQQTCHAPPTRE